MRWVSACLVGLCWLLSSAPAEASLELRGGAELDLRLARILSASLEQELRYDGRPGEPQQWLSSVELGLRPQKFFRLELGYRISRRSLGNTVELRHRLWLAARLRARLGPLRLTFRERYQLRPATTFDELRQHLVSKATLALRSHSLPFEPSCWVELFARLPKGSSPFLADKLRFGLGLMLPLGLCELSLEGQLERSLRQPEEPLLPILSMQLEFEMDLRRSRR